MQGDTDTSAASLTDSLLKELREQALCFRFEVAPNPCVGAAILSGGEVVARGFHERWGGAHAEVNAIAAARAAGVPESAWDALVVTLEPCSSEGKTPACVAAILEAGIPRVVIGALDPDPRHAGAAIGLLEEASVEVEVCEERGSFESENAAFCNWVSQDRARALRPWVIAKWAQTRTGQLSPPEDVGDGRWISAEASRVEVHALRGRVDAILTGAGTIKSDDPELSLHGSSGVVAPKRVVLDSYLRTSPSARLFQQGTGGGAGEVIILTLAGADGGRWRALEEVGARIAGLHGDESGRVSLADAYQWMWGEGMRRVLLESGPELLASHFDSEFIDQLRVYSGAVSGGRGVSLGMTLAGLKFSGRMDRECGSDAVLEAFLLPKS